MQTQKEQLIELITRISALVSISDNQAPPDYASLKELVINQELTDELAALKNILDGDFNNFAETFKKRCQQRNQRNTNTCLSMTAMPGGVCNQLYWQIAIIVFKPQTYAELFTLFFPDVNVQLSCTLQLNDKQPESKYPDISLVTLQFQQLHADSSLNALPDATVPAHFVIAGKLIFDLQDIAAFDFVMHEKFHAGLQAHFPDLALKLYQHNDALKTLHNKLLLVTGHGQSLKQVIQRFIRECKTGGNLITGEEYATISTQVAYTEFVHYLEGLSSAMKTALLNMKTNSHPHLSLSDIWNHLKQGNCVETAARDLDSVLNNKENESLLNTSPNVASEDKAEILRQYRKPQTANLPVTGNEVTTVLPEVYLSQYLSLIVINDTENYLDFLLNFPPDSYTRLLQYANITCTPELPLTLARFIASGGIDSAQLALFEQAIIANHEKSGGKSAVLKFALIAKAISLLTSVLDLYDSSELLDTIKQKDSRGVTILHRAATNPEALKIILASLPEEQRLEAVKEKDEYGNNVLHLAVENPEALNVILALYPEEQRLEAVKEKDRNGSNILHRAATNPAALNVILASLPEEQRLEAVKAKDKDGRSVLRGSRKC